MTKRYVLTKGSCKDCTLSKECKINLEGIKHFLLTHKILCETGKRVEVVID